MDTSGASIDLSLVDPSTLTVAADVACVKCEYNLRSLKAEGLCPECGGAVVDSLRSDALWLADQKWLETVRNGFALLTADMFGLIALMMLAGLCWVVDWAFGVFLLSGLPLGALTGLMMLGSVAAVVALVLGLICATSAEPQARSSPIRIRRLRSLLHACMMLVIVLPSVLAIVAVVAGLSWAPILPVLGVVGVSVVFGVGLTRYLRWLALRSRKPRLAEWAGWVGWLTGLCGLLLTGQVLITPLLGPLYSVGSPTIQSADVAVVRGCFDANGCVLMVIVPVAFVGWMVLVVLYYRLLRSVVNTAGRRRSAEIPA